MNKPKTVPIPDDLHEKLKVICAKLDMKLYALVEAVIKAGLKTLFEEEGGDID